MNRCGKPSHVQNIVDFIFLFFFKKRGGKKKKKNETPKPIRHEQRPKGEIPGSPPQPQTPINSVREASSDRVSSIHKKTSVQPREPQSKPGTKMVYPEPCTGLRRRISAAIYGWDRPILTFIYPGGSCGLSDVIGAIPC